MEAQQVGKPDLSNFTQFTATGPGFRQRPFWLLPTEIVFAKKKKKNAM